MRRLATTIVPAGALLISTAVTAPGAGAAVVGQLTERAQCFGSTSPECTARSEMSSPTAVAVSPDGKNVYVASGGTSAGLTVFARSSNGSLSPLPGTDGCITADGSSGACQAVGALVNPGDIAVSPDGSRVYVVATSTDTLLQLDRDLATGALSFTTGRCFAPTSDNGCTATAGMSGLRHLVVSADGNSVLTAAVTAGAVARFHVSGAGLTADGCVSGADGACTEVDTLLGATGIAVSPDGASVYVAAPSTDTVSILRRDTVTTDLAYQGCLGPDPSCTPFLGMAGVRAVTVSPDGGSVYTAAVDGNNHGVIGAFSRSKVVGSTLGVLRQLTGAAGCLSDDAAADPEYNDGAACTRTHGAAGAFAVVVSPDGHNVYAPSPSSSSVAALSRAGTGALTEAAGAAGCVSEDGSSSCAHGHGLALALGAAVSPGAGNQVYVVSGLGGIDSGLTIFDRHLYPNTSITSGPKPTTRDRTPTFRFTSTDAGSTFQCKVGTASYRRCTSPFTTAKLRLGKHTFYVRATNSAGYTDPSAAHRTFKVV